MLRFLKVGLLRSGCVWRNLWWRVRSLSVEGALRDDWLARRTTQAQVIPSRLAFVSASGYDF
jgi:hypothetical protein